MLLKELPWYEKPIVVSFVPDKCIFVFLNNPSESKGAGLLGNKKMS
jgi:hypothetical protein